MDLFDRGLIRLMLQTRLSPAEVKLGRIEYLEPLLPWFYLLIFISFHRPRSSYVLRNFGWWWKRSSALFLNLVPTLTQI